MIREVASAGIAINARQISYAVRNIGPTNGPALPVIPMGSTEVVDRLDTTSYFTAFTTPLAPGAEQTYEATLPVVDCDTITYLIKADSIDVVDEYNETNNTTEVQLAPLVSTGLCNSVHIGSASQEADLTFINEQGLQVVYDKLDAPNAVEWGSDRATGVDIGPGLPILDQVFD